MYTRIRERSWITLVVIQRRRSSKIAQPLQSIIEPMTKEHWQTWAHRGAVADKKFLTNSHVQSMTVHKSKNILEDATKHCALQSHESSIYAYKIFPKCRAHAPSILDFWHFAWLVGHLPYSAGNASMLPRKRHRR